MLVVVKFLLGQSMQVSYRL